MSLWCGIVQCPPYTLFDPPDNLMMKLTISSNLRMTEIGSNAGCLNLDPNSFFSPFIFISWRLITLQYYSGFCHTLTWISHGFTCAPHPNPPSHLPLHLIPLGLPSAPGPSTCLMHPAWAGDLFHPDNIHVSMLFSRNIPPWLSPTESKSLFCTFVSLFLFCI